MIQELDLDLDGLMEQAGFRLKGVTNAPEFVHNACYLLCSVQGIYDLDMNITLHLSESLDVLSGKETKQVFARIQFLGCSEIQKAHQANEIAEFMLKIREPAWESSSSTDLGYEVPIKKVLAHIYNWVLYPFLEVWTRDVEDLPLLLAGEWEGWYLHTRLGEERLRGVSPMKYFKQIDKKLWPIAVNEHMNGV